MFLIDAMNITVNVSDIVHFFLTPSRHDSFSTQTTSPSLLHVPIPPVSEGVSINCLFHTGNTDLKRLSAILWSFSLSGDFSPTSL